MTDIDVLSEISNQSEHAKVTINTCDMELEYSAYNGQSPVLIYLTYILRHLIDAKLHSPAGHVRWHEDLHLRQD